MLQGRDACSVRVLVPDCRGVDQNFHDVAIVDMGDMPVSQSTMAPSGPQSHGVAPERTGGVDRVAVCSVGA